jgi:hypothetical protein
MSFNVHDRADATLLAGATDVEVDPLTGHVNPFRVGSRRDGGRRSYTLVLARSDAATLSAQVPTIVVPATSGETLELRLLYRIYLPDSEHPGGGVALPRVWRIDENGARTEVAGRGCPRRGVVDGAQEVGPTRIPPGPSVVTMPLDWRNAGGSASAANSDVYVNRDNGYAYALTQLDAESLLVLTARAPTHPRTRDGDAVMEDGEVRYWSLCAYRHPSDRSARCVADEDVSIDALGVYRVVLGPPGSHRDVAAAECALTWLEAPSVGDGAIVLRHVAPRADFAFTPLRGGHYAPSEEVMGPYLPRARLVPSDSSLAALCAE